MHPSTIELMRDQVDAIYRALTGAEIPEPLEEPAGSEIAADEVARRFATLESLARTIPSVMHRVPPFSFSPPVDAIDRDHDVIVEVAVPGVTEEDITVNCTGDLLVVTGIRRGERTPHGGFMLAEIPRGPFYRLIRLTSPIEGRPEVTFDKGLIIIRLNKQPVPEPVRTVDKSTSEDERHFNGGH